jgi:adenine-specific DNA-methyltransferase
MLAVCTEPNTGDVVLDFFAGSCTTAQAVFQRNADDGGNRRFIMVQLPEPIPADSQAWQAGFRSISAIGKERLRRAIARLDKEEKGKLKFKGREASEGLGFKVFTLAESNHQRWRGTDAKTGAALLGEMAKQVDPLLPGWKPLNIIYEVALKEGYSLTCGVEEFHHHPGPHPTRERGQTVGNTVYRVTDADKGQSFLICLDDKLKAGALRALGLKKDDLFICRDVALTDEQAANLALQCKLKTI